MEKGDQKKKQDSVVRMMAGVMCAVLLVAVCVGAEIWKEYRDSVVKNQQTQLLLTVRGLSDSMEEFIDSYRDDLNGLYQMTEENWAGEEADWEVLHDYVRSHGRRVYDVIVTDPDGNVEDTIRGSRIRHVYTTTEIDDTSALHLATIQNGGFYLVLRKTVPGGGRFYLLVDAEQYYETLMSGLRVGTNGYVLLKDSRGNVMLHPERAQWGINVIGGRLKLYADSDLDLESLQNMIDEQNKGKEGVADYYSYWWMDPNHPRVRKICAYAPVRLGDDFLVVSAVMDYNDVLGLVTDGVGRLIAVFLIFFLVMGGMALAVGRLILQRQKDTEQITYLLELNRILEEMHQSEEHIAHQQRLQIMGTMTGGIAHEFNNLLTPIMGYADLLMMDLPENSESYENAEEIYEASAKAKEIIQQISSLSRKNMETAYKDMDAEKVLERALKMIHSVCPSNVQVETQIQLDNAHILCNETQMNQVILNISVNAIYAMGKDNGRLQIRAAVRSRESLPKRVREKLPGAWRRYVRLEIQDNGCGMSSDVLKQVFDPFFTTKKGGKGTGLGLALAEQIIASHKGYIEAESQIGVGSTFTIYLPVNEQKERTADVGEEQPEGLRMLILDDNPKVLQILKKDADRQKIYMEGCMNVEEARERLKKGTFDIMAADQDLGTASALDFCMSIQGQYPELCKVIMTSQVTKELVEAKQRGIIQAYIEKPVSVMAITAAR